MPPPRLARAARPNARAPASCSASTTAAPASASSPRRCSSRRSRSGRRACVAGRVDRRWARWRCVATWRSSRRDAAARRARRTAAATPRALSLARVRASALAGYLMFGLGYIGYMTFVVTLLREQRLAGAVIVAFYVLLGAGVIASSWLWARLLQRWRGGSALAPAERAARGRDRAAGAERAPARRVRLGRAVRRRVPVGRRIDHRAGAPQPAAGRVAGGIARLHDRLRRRADRRPEPGRLGRRRAGGLRARLRVLGRACSRSRRSWPRARSRSCA